jgi:hypothetical protein
VPTTLIHAGKYKKFSYSTAPKRRKVEINVEASAPVDIYVVQESELETWRAGDHFSGFSFPTGKQIEETITIPKDFDTDWYLIVQNRNDNDVAVHYELFDL